MSSASLLPPGSRSRRQYAQLEASLARSFIWLLRLFSFLLDVTADYLYEELRRVEAQVLSGWRGTCRRRTGADGTTDQPTHL